MPEREGPTRQMSHSVSDAGAAKAGQQVVYGLRPESMALEESAARVIDIVDERARRLGGRLRRPPNVSSDLPHA